MTYECPWALRYKPPLQLQRETLQAEADGNGDRQQRRFAPLPSAGQSGHGHSIGGMGESVSIEVSTECPRSVHARFIAALRAMQPDGVSARRCGRVHSGRGRHQAVDSLRP